MATIKISDLRPAGTELFQDSESFLNELTEPETGNLLGGILIIANTSFCLSGRRCVAIL
jgi:hypothetical protein